ncbi:hypothetical protein JIG36_38950 [Actinoplanes sp. LDG1-06]|uniref:Uncharacterized protein n=1 Tax=Paractinoplanes ovalisporus TaxID=2810368 RepID=A0ABS2ANW3_9ACTN|nr:hypothetical protein [Actinoplanes ovalisporus]MBM2621500.1 hypothetical protein [Actinoplanes ovalisporus]
MTWGQIAALAGLGAFHGLNPAMGWLFAVARAMQERSRAVLVKSLPPIALGHLASVAIVAAVVSATSSVVAANIVGIVGGVVLVGFGLWRLLSERHFRWAGMRLSSAQLAGWSFLMSSAHGAGLMLLPVLATTPVVSGEHSGHAMPGAASGALEGIAAAGVHTLAMFAAMAACAFVVYEFVGVNILRRAWFNMDRVWAGVMVGAGALTIALSA